MAKPKTVALFFHDDAFDVAGKVIVGRRMAGHSFLKAVALYEPSALLNIFAISRKQFDIFQRLFKPLRAGRSDRAIAIALIKPGQAEKLAAAGGVFRVDPILDEYAWLRRSIGRTAYSISGITHTLCTVGTQSAIAAQLASPLESWDALICTSHAVRQAVEKIHAEQAAFFAERFGTPLNLRPKVQLPVIPLGVHCEDFDTTSQETAFLRGRTRRRLGIGPQDLCFLYVGRLTHHAKANPLPMLRALQRAAERTRRGLHLLQVGVFSSKTNEALYVAAAKQYAPAVRCHFLDGADEKTRASARAAADVFTSLTDNLQETFGLTPLEAMASGLPVVVTDWNGYRETVRDRVDGFLVPTTMTPAGSGDDLALRHFLHLDDYGHFAGTTALSIAVDEAAAVDAYVALIQNADLRHRMGEAGRQRARETFSWERVYGLYRELWGELDERRQAAAGEPRQGPVLPAHPDPFHTYSHYATFTYGPTTEVALQEGVGIGSWRAMAAEPLLHVTGKDEPLTAAELEALYGQLAAAGPTTVKTLSELVAKDRRHLGVRAIGWLLKADLVRLVNPIVVQGRPAPLE